MHASIRPEDRVGEIAARYPAATRVFSAHGIDFCCGGGAPLADVCARRDLEVGPLLDEIHRLLAAGSGDSRSWEEAPVGELVDHLVGHHHAELRSELPRLETMAEKVARVHGAKDPQRLPELHRIVTGLRADLEEHMDREEELFPRFLRGDAAVDDVEDLVDEHSATGRELARLRQITDGYRAPEGACTTWRALWHGLEELEGLLHEHVHLENHVLFPRLRDTGNGG